jgi:hypothetical protein
MNATAANVFRTALTPHLRSRWPVVYSTERTERMNQSAAVAQHFDRRRKTKKGGSALARIIWNRAANPPLYVSQSLEIAHWQLRSALHKIKAKSNLGQPIKS